MEQAPVSLRKTLEELTDLEVIASHGADKRHQFFANISGHGFLVHFDGQVVAALGRIFVEGTLEEIQRLVDLTLELFLAEPEEFGLFSHKYAYIYAYFGASKSACQEGRVRNSLETEA